MKPFSLLNSPLAGLNLIEASAGTGKTYTLTGLVLRLIAEQDVPLSRILVVTFTNAATAELKVRIRERLEDLSLALRSDAPQLDPLVAKLKEMGSAMVAARIQNALRVIDEAAVHTIHGFCHRMLLEQAFESGLPLDSELLQDCTSEVKEAVRMFWGRHVLGGDQRFIDYLEDQKIWPSKFESFFGIVSRHPDVQVEVGEIASDDAGVDVLAPFERAKAQWLASKDSILELLTSQTGVLHKGKYPLDKRLAHWTLELDRYFGLDGGARIVSIEALKKLNRSALELGTNKKHDTPAHPFFDSADELLSAIDDAAIWHRKKLNQLFKLGAEQLPRLVEELMKKRALLSYDDLLGLMYRGALDPSGEAFRESISRRFSAVLIDEFQDTDGRQYEIFNKVFGDGNRPFFVIGDPKQSIYRFRGADIYTYLRARGHAEGKTYTLDKNWRSDSSLVGAVEQLFLRAPNPFVEEKIAFGHVEAASEKDTSVSVLGEMRPAFEIDYTYGDNNPGETAGVTGGWGHEHIPTLVAREVQLLLESGRLGEHPIVPSDVAVLVYSNREVASIAESLEARGIPVVLSTSQSVFQIKEADELSTVLMAIAHPERKGLIRTALTGELFNFSAMEVASLQSDKERFETVNLVFRKWHRLWQTKGVLHVLEAVMDNRLGPGGGTALTRVLSYTDGSRRYTAYRQLTDVIHALESRHHLKMHALCRLLDKKRETDQLVSDEEQLTSSPDEGAVRVMTYHKSKGLEFPIVFCPYVCLGGSDTRTSDYRLLHNVDDDMTKVLYWGKDAPDAYKSREAFETRAEEMRVLYVALTRGKHHCKVIWAPFKHLYNSTLGNLLHPPLEGEAPKDRKERLLGTPARDLVKELGALAEASLNMIGIRDVSRFDLKHPYQSLQTDQELLLLRPKSLKRQSQVWTSFSALLASDDGPLDPFADEGLDTRVVADTPPTEGVAAEPCLFGDLDRGMLAGSCLHKIYEDIDFSSKDKSELIKRTLRTFGFDHETLAGPVAESVNKTLLTTLNAGDDGLKLGALSPHVSVREMEFLLGLGASTNTSQLSAAHLGDIAVDYLGSSATGNYKALVSDIYSGRLSGFLRGFIDLVFEHNGRYFVADYKSNYLGPTIGHYGQSAMGAEMEKHHYVLQSLFYSFALHRHLERTVDAYSYDQHFGGAYFLFLRGMHPKAAGQYGVFFKRAPAGLFDRLHNLLEGGAQIG